jgi:hypothetical protein
MFHEFSLSDGMFQTLKFLFRAFLIALTLNCWKLDSFAGRDTDKANAPSNSEQSKNDKAEEVTKKPTDKEKEKEEAKAREIAKKKEKEIALAKAKEKTDDPPRAPDFVGLVEPACAATVILNTKAFFSLKTWALTMSKLGSLVFPRLALMLCAPAEPAYMRVRAMIEVRYLFIKISFCF